jgi:hypothetical protein
MATELLVEAAEQSTIAMALAVEQAEQTEAAMEDPAMAKVQGMMAVSEAVAALPMGRATAGRRVVGRSSCHRIRWGARRWK